MTARKHDTYAAYCAYNAARGYQVIPERLWDALKKSEDPEN
jgi:hypothetical protein